MLHLFVVRSMTDINGAHLSGAGLIDSLSPVAEDLNSMRGSLKHWCASWGFISRVDITIPISVIGPPTINRWKHDIIVMDRELLSRNNLMEE